jgi:hypothetical protein
VTTTPISDSCHMPPAPRSNPPSMLPQNSTIQTSQAAPTAVRSARPVRHTRNSPMPHIAPTMTEGIGVDG